MMAADYLTLTAISKSSATSSCRLVEELTVQGSLRIVDLPGSSGGRLSIDNRPRC